MDNEQAYRKADQVQKGKAGWQVQGQVSGVNTRTDCSLGNGKTVQLGTGVRQAILI